MCIRDSCQPWTKSLAEIFPTYDSFITNKMYPFVTFSHVPEFKEQFDQRDIDAVVHVQFQAKRFTLGIILGTGVFCHFMEFRLKRRSPVFGLTSSVGFMKPIVKFVFIPLTVLRIAQPFISGWSQPQIDYILSKYDFHTDRHREYFETNLKKKSREEFAQLIMSGANERGTLKTTL
eukprot:TRINITY_DN3854_c0_g1_i3.p1 TRINITY_DN3854_c0_g1~~TRINITY_DN3854_c0_g1_i3.p1  ORF type:complete len:188 (+),score=8.78 TRINITY_DN3854_c0_g1_i3:39-566(+)